MRKLRPLVQASAFGIASVLGVAPVLAAPIVSQEIVVNTIPNGPVTNSVASLNGTHLVAWRGANSTIPARRVSGDGVVAPNTATLNVASLDSIDVTTANGGFVVVSRGQFFYDAGAVSADGVLGGQLTSNTIPIDPAIYQYSSGLHVATTGSTYMFLYPYFGTTDASGDPSGNYHGVNLLRGNGDDLALPVWHTPSVDMADHALALATDGTNFLALTHHVEGWNTDEDRFAIYSPQGALLSSGVSECSGLTAAWNGNAYLVIDQSGSDLKGCFLDTNGKKVGEIALIGSVPSAKSEPHAVWDGARTLVVWEDKRNGHEDIYGNWLLPGGLPEVAGDVAISLINSGYQVLGGVSSSMPGRGVVSLSLDNKVAVRFLSTTLAPTGQPCNGFDCQSGHCVDGVCCDSACGGGDPNDCQACSVAAGAPVDGVCAPVSEGDSCDDASACTSNDVCVAGTCMGAQVDCIAPTECQSSNGCDPASGACTFAPVPDGTPCSAGLCMNGVCFVEDPGTGGTGGATTTSSTTTPTNTPTPTATVPGGDPPEQTKDQTVVAGTCAASPSQPNGNLALMLTGLALAILANRRARKSKP